jgi:hypothetical protein
MASFNFSADALEFVPAALREAAPAPEAAAAAAAPVADPAKRLNIDVLGGARPKRTLTMHAMAAPRTDGLTKGHGPFNSIGAVFHGYNHDDDADSLAEDDEAVEIGCHDNDYRVKTIVRPIPGVEALEAGDFPNNIREYYWINDGKNDEHPWYVLGRLANDAYFYFVASCNFSGFECEGQMTLYLANDLQTLYDNGMEAAARLRFASCFDKGTREKLKADAAAAKAARVAAAKARQAAAAAKPRVVPTYAAQKARMAAGAAALQASFAAGRAGAAAAGGGGGAPAPGRR